MPTALLDRKWHFFMEHQNQSLEARHKILRKPMQNYANTWKFVQNCEKSSVNYAKKCKNLQNWEWKFKNNFSLFYTHQQNVKKYKIEQKKCIYINKVGFWCWRLIFGPYTKLFSLSQKLSRHGTMLQHPELVWGRFKIFYK